MIESMIDRREGAEGLDEFDFLEAEGIWYASLPDLDDLVDPNPDLGDSPFDLDPPGLRGLECSELAAWRERLATADLPDQEAALIDLLRELEDLKSTSAAIQARAAVRFKALRVQAEADAGVPATKRGVGIGAEVALARRESPYRGGRLLGLAHALVHELPHTLDNLAKGVVNEWRATLVARETACLEITERLTIDEWLATHLAQNPGVGDARLVGELRRQVIAADQHAFLRRMMKAAESRSVTIRALPDGMVRISATLPVREGVAAYAAVKKAADQAPTLSGRGAAMADIVVERLTGRPADDPAPVALTVVITDQSLFNVSSEPAHVDGYGPAPAAWVRDILARTTDAGQKVAFRRLFTGPGRTVKLETAQRFMTPGLRRLIAIRDQSCRTPWCSAPIRQHDHVRGHADGGPTSLLNSQGLCEACNYAKQAPGWSATVHEDPDGRHRVTTVTPTGHRYESGPPSGPGDPCVLAQEEGREND